MITWIAVVVLFLFPVLAFAKIGGGDVRYKPKNAGEVLFRHESHANIKCTKCHYHPFQMAAGSYKMKMESLTKGEFCGKCHNGKDAFDVKSQETCSRCHEE